MPPATATRGPGDLGGGSSQTDQDGEGGGREGDRGPADVGEVVDDGPQLGDEVVGGRVPLDAEQAGELPGGDRQPDPDLDAGQGGLGDVVDQHAEAERPGDQQDHADEQGQGGQGAGRIVAAGGDAGGQQGRAGEDGHGRGGADRQGPRPAEQRVHRQS
jgi:hypothetical protein